LNIYLPVGKVEKVKLSKKMIYDVADVAVAKGESEVVNEDT
jgi:hypothetical protein